MRVWFFRHVFVVVVVVVAVFITLLLMVFVFSFSRAMCVNLELQRMFEHSNIIRLRFSRTNFFLRTNVR